MPLPKPRKGLSAGFYFHPYTTQAATLADPEKIIWSSIKQLCNRVIADQILSKTYGIKSARQRANICYSLKLYIHQSAEFYEAGQHAKPNTSPLFYYYSFLNLAKARCEIQKPRFHQYDECYRHGLSWKPSADRVVNLETECVSLSTRGVWHVLWESLTGLPCRAPNPLKLRIKDLFLFCLETGVELKRTFGKDTRLIKLVEPDVKVDPKKEEAWLTFSVDREQLKDSHLSRPQFLRLITLDGSRYRQVESSKPDIWTFELETPRKFDHSDVHSALAKEIKKFNCFTVLDGEEIQYFVPIQTNLPLLLPQIMVFYTLLFWLGSLVRYDPHSLADLEESGYWILIDGFMNQSRIWLLELFEWELYKLETTLRSVR